MRKETWTGIAEGHIVLQDPSGGFAYHAAHKPSRGMTAASLSTLLICREQIALLREKEPPLLAATIERGFKYLDLNFDVRTNPSPHLEGQDSYHHCYLSALENAGSLSGRAQIGGVDWYARGSAFLVRAQDSKGRWDDETGPDPQDVLGTCFALLFLKKATIAAVTR